MVAAPLDLFLRIVLFGLTIILTVMTAIAYKHVRSTKLLLISLGFLAFTAKAAILVLGIVDPELYADFNIPTEILVIDCIAVVLLYAGTVKK